ncbi:MAG: hypothetical protein JNM84_05500 [Planctomycetes bacterium]|nr:hypothetical protein [Planctomycetota bacterium]
MTPLVPTRRLLVAATDGGVLRCLLPLAAALRGRGWTVGFWTPFLRDRMWLRCVGEHPLPATRAGTEALPASLEPALALRAQVGGLRLDERLRRHAAAQWRAAREAVGRFDAALVWNGGELQAACVAEAARAEGKPVVYLENGLLPRTLQIDARGVNAAAAARERIAASAADAPRWIAPVAGAPLRCAEPSLLFRWCATAAEWIEALAHPERARFALHVRRRALRQARRRKRPVAGDATPLPERFVFVPLQVHDDTQVLRHGGWVRSMEDLLQAVRAASPLPVVVREHPMDVGRADLRSLKARYPEFLWTRTRSLEECLRRASAVATINSTVGVEALALGRPVVVCGDCVYGVEGLVHLASEPAALRPALAAACARESAPAAVESLLGALARELHVALDRQKPDAAGLARLVQRIEELVLPVMSLASGARSSDRSASTMAATELVGALS